ncbi:hypothetical protein V6N13_083061 [Hibiscus sabdariffa]
MQVASRRRRPVVGKVVPNNGVGINVGKQVSGSRFMVLDEETGWMMVTLVYMRRGIIEIARRLCMRKRFFLKRVRLLFCVSTPITRGRRNWVAVSG